MDSISHGNPSITAQYIAAAERQREAREAARQAWLIRESEIAFGKHSDRDWATVRQILGAALIRAGALLNGASGRDARRAHVRQTTDALPATGR